MSKDETPIPKVPLSTFSPLIQISGDNSGKVIWKKSQNPFKQQSKSPRNSDSLSTARLLSERKHSFLKFTNLQGMCEQRQEEILSRQKTQRSTSPKAHEFTSRNFQVLMRKLKKQKNVSPRASSEDPFSKLLQIVSKKQYVKNQKSTSRYDYRSSDVVKINPLSQHILDLESVMSRESER